MAIFLFIPCLPLHCSEYLSRVKLTLYDLGQRISSVWSKFYFKIRRDHKKIPMSAAPMTR